MTSIDFALIPPRPVLMDVTFSSFTFSSFKNGIRSGENVEQNAETLNRLFSINANVGAVTNPPQAQDIPPGETGDETAEELSCDIDETSEM